ncbi:minor structural protein VP3 [Chaerephon polyomavirus 1]|nr:minor structural protein VP3 [Chaerephon polyomavirus 1]AGA82576.1 minor structural protein VP3 [Chaerephon polyomavirus 1]
MTIESLSGIEALAQLGWTAEQFSQLSFIATTFSQTVGYGVLFQTVTGISSLISVGIRMGLKVADVNRGQLESQLRGIFGNIVRYLHVNLSHQMNPLLWCDSLHTNLPDELLQLDPKLLHTFGEILSSPESRWVVQQVFTSDPSQESGDVIQYVSSPGGTHHNVTPDWLLALVLRLNGSEEKTPLCQ